MGFRFEKLKVWPKALEFADCVITLSLKWPHLMQSSFGDQIRRAAVSVVANVTEANGKRTERSRRVYYDHAKGSIYEVIGILSLAKKRNMIDEQQYNTIYVMGDEIAAMLWGLMQAQDRLGTGENTHA